MLDTEHPAMHIVDKQVRLPLLSQIEFMYEARMDGVLDSVRTTE